MKIVIDSAEKLKNKKNLIIYEAMSGVISASLTASMELCADICRQDPAAAVKIYYLSGNPDVSYICEHIMDADGNYPTDMPELHGHTIQMNRYHLSSQTIDTEVSLTALINDIINDGPDVYKIVIIDNDFSTDEELKWINQWISDLYRSPNGDNEETPELPRITTIVTHQVKSGLLENALDTVGTLYHKFHKELRSYDNLGLITRDDNTISLRVSCDVPALNQWHIYWGSR